MNTTIIFIAMVISEAISWESGLTVKSKEEVMPLVTVRLVRKAWRPEGFDPGTDEPLPRFPGNIDQLFDLIPTFAKKFGHVSEPLISAKKLFDDYNYNASLPSVILTHPMTIGDSEFISKIVIGLTLRNLQKNYNVFAMHAPWLSVQIELSCARAALGLEPLFKPVAEAFASFLLDGIALGKMKPQQINFIGFSYAGTLNAYIAREIREKTGQLIHTLMLLEAFQYNHGNRFIKPITRRDAMFVHMIHTSSKVTGTERRYGTVDIVVNNGYYQPLCAISEDQGLVGCSHRRAISIFTMGLLFQGEVLARQCDSWEEFSQCKCSNKPLLVVSFPVNEEARGTFFLRTTGKSPYALGLNGANCEAKAKKHS